MSSPSDRCPATAPCVASTQALRSRRVSSASKLPAPCDHKPVRPVFQTGQAGFGQTGMPGLRPQPSVCQNHVATGVLRQDELARSDKMNSLAPTPKITRSAPLPSVCQNHVATGVLLVLGTNSTSNLNTHAPTTSETTRKLAVQRGRLDRYRGRLDRLHQATKKSFETPLPSTKTHHGFTNKDLWSRPC
jgi:hypothetical protein